MAVSTDMQQKVHVILMENIYDYTIIMQFYVDKFQPHTKLTHEQHCRLAKIIWPKYLESYQTGKFWVLPTPKLPR